VRIEDEGINRYKFGDFRVVAAADASMRAVWMVTGSRIEDFDRSPQATRVAMFDPLSPGERREATELDHRLRAVYRAAGRSDLVHQLDDGVSLFSERPVPGLDQAELDRYEVLRRVGVPVAVFMMDRADQSPPDGPA
jgi:hypothetical protein